MTEHTILIADNNVGFCKQLSKVLPANISVRFASSQAEIKELTQFPSSYDLIYIGEFSEVNIDDFRCLLESQLWQPIVLLHIESCAELASYGLFKHTHVSKLFESTPPAEELSNDILTLLDQSDTIALVREQRLETTTRLMKLISDIGGELCDGFLDGLTEATEAYFTSMKGSFEWHERLICDLIPAGFVMLAPEELDTIKSGDIDSPAFQLAFRRAFQSVCTIVRDIARVSHLARTIASIPFSCPIKDEAWSIHQRAGYFHLLVLWTIFKNQGMGLRDLRLMLFQQFPRTEQKIIVGLIQYGAFSPTERRIPLSQLEPGMVVLEDVELPIGDVIFRKGDSVDQISLDEYGDELNHLEVTILTATNSLEEQEPNSDSGEDERASVANARSEIFSMLSTHLSAIE